MLDTLDERRAAFRKQREAGEVALDALMPIAPGLEERWKYWVPQPIPQDAIDKAPDSVRTLKLLDPACGSGHFLVIACDLLFALYQEEAAQRGESWSDKQIVESILANNLHGIDIDPNAVRIAAAALMLKAKQLCPQAEPQLLNLVAPNLSLASLPESDRIDLYESIEREIGIPRALIARMLKALEGADHLGTLLKVDAEVEGALKELEDKLGKRKAQQGKLFESERFEPTQLELVSLSEARETLLGRLEEFLARHTAGEDLGLRLKGEQLAAGVRFVRMVREGQYDLVVGNPPYQGTSKMADAAYVIAQYPCGRADLYAAFLERSFQLLRNGGTSALLTLRNWMFIKQFSALREWLLSDATIAVLGDVDRGAFEEIPDEVVSAVLNVVRRAAPRGGQTSIVVQPTPLSDASRDGDRTRRKRASLLCQTGRFGFSQSALRDIAESPLVYWWSETFLRQYVDAPKLGDSTAVRSGMASSNNARFLRMPWEVTRFAAIRIEEALDERIHNTQPWAPYIKGAAGRSWIEPLSSVVRWSRRGFEVRACNESWYGSYTRQIKNEAWYFVPGVSFSPNGNEFSARAHRYRSVIDVMGNSVFPDDVYACLMSLNMTVARSVLQALNPSFHFQVGDVVRLPLRVVANAREIYQVLDRAFTEHESCRETSVEFTQSGPSSWRHAQVWAQRATDRSEGEPLPPYTPEFDAEEATEHFSFGLGVALGRFDAKGKGILDSAPATALPHGILCLSAASDHDSLTHPAAAPILTAWQTHGVAIDPKRTLKQYLAEKFFPDVHRKMYENRPIYFPLSSKNKSFVAYVSIHRWTADTLRALLAEHLYPEKQRLEGEQTDLRVARQSADKKQARDAETRAVQVGKWLDELEAFIKLVEQCAEKGPPPTDGKCKPRERDARYDPDLDDGVMINAAALWPLLEPQWKDPAKWWKELANAEGKKDYDWAHLSARYFPTRVNDKCQKDPSLAVAHGCFWKYHPEKAYQWELRLQQEIGPDFKLDEAARATGEAYSAAWVQLSSDDYREALEAAHPEKVKALVDAEMKRREKKRKKGGEGEEEAQGELGLDGDAAEDDA